MMKMYTCALWVCVLFAEVALRVMPCGIVNKRFAEKHFDVVVSPVLCRKRLQEHDNALRVQCEDRTLVIGRRSYDITYLEVHFLQLFAPLHQERGADVEMKL